MKLFSLTIGLLLSALPVNAADFLSFAGKKGEAGNGKRIVLIAGDEEYRSEEAMPMLAQLISRQGFDCTVLFSVNEKGEVDQRAAGSLSNPAALDDADLVMLSIRFRDWDDEAMEKFDAMVKRGTPILALRTTTHAFKIGAGSRWAKYSFNAPKDSEWPGGFGKKILGETWVSHHGKHKFEGCRGVVEAKNADADILNGVGRIFVEADVYEAHPPEDARILLRGEVTESLEADSGPVEAKNNPMMPIVWTRELDALDGSGKKQRIVTNTMGAASDLDDENLRRLVVNSVFWALEMDVPERVDVEVDGVYEPTFYGTKLAKEGLKPEDYRVKKKLRPQQ